MTLISSSGRALPAAVRLVRDRFERWRKNKSGRERIPQQLWFAAVKLCARHGIERVRRWLRLNYAALRERVERERRSSQKKKSAPAFVEWVSTGPRMAVAAGAEYVLEVGDVRLRVRGAAVADVVELAAKLLRRNDRP